MTDATSRVSLDSEFDNLFLAEVLNEACSLEDDFTYCHGINIMAHKFVDTTDVESVITKNKNLFYYAIQLFCQGNIQDGKYNERALEFLKRYDVTYKKVSTKQEFFNT